jgi:2-polyprenyl-3-methyl-5-hydroxy-6-metoxy-1,4-benzoquinol methylase
MRTAADFNNLYANPDPWGIDKAARRDRALARIIAPHVEGKTVLELGCGEGHLTATVFQSAAWVTGVDISQVAILRTPKLANARFAAMDFMSPDVSFEGQDVIAALECLYYLSPEEQEAFFRKLNDQHRGTFIMSAPIIGSNQHRDYYTHEGLLKTFKRYKLTVVEHGNVSVYWKGLGGKLAVVASKLSDRVIQFCPERFVYQRCYVLKCA